MKPTWLGLAAAPALVMFVVHSGLFAADTAAEQKKELMEDVCHAYSQWAALGRENASMERNRLISHRLHQLCRRYKDRYGNWPERCCQEARWMDAEELKALARKMRGSQQAEKNIASLFPEDRREKCYEFYNRYDFWPDPCASGAVPTPTPH